MIPLLGIGSAWALIASLRQEALIGGVGVLAMGVVPALVLVRRRPARAGPA